MILSWVANEAEYKNQLVPVTRYDHILRMISSIGSLPRPVNDIPSRSVTANNVATLISSLR